MTRELSRPYPRERVGEGAAFFVEANEAERAALARRMGLVAVKSLTCGFELSRPEGGAIPASGVLRALVVQVCVISLEPFEAEVEDEFAVRFVPAGTEAEDIDLDAPDEIPYEGNMLDLGEAAAEQLALALDPFPRKPDAQLPAEIAAPANPFAALGKLKQQG